MVRALAMMHATKADALARKYLNSGKDFLGPGEDFLDPGEDFLSPGGDFLSPRWGFSQLIQVKIFSSQVRIF